MFCPKCGFSLIDNICPNCHYSSSADEIDTPADNQKEEQTKKQEQEQVPLRKCENCGGINQSGNIRCTFCGEIFNDDIPPNLNEFEKRKFFIIGLRLVYKAICEKNPKYKKCPKCNSDLTLNDEMCPNCNSPTFLYAIKEIFSGNYEYTVLNELDSLLPEFTIQEQTNGAYLSVHHIISIKNDCDTIASTLIKNINLLATFLKSFLVGYQNAQFTNPMIDYLFRSRSNIEGEGEPNTYVSDNEPVPSPDIYEKVRRLSKTPKSPWNNP